MKLILKPFGLQKRLPLITEEEIKSFVKVGREEGTIDETEKKLIENIFRFDDINASEIMAPRTDMISLSADLKIKQIFKYTLKYPFSSFPVLEHTNDHVIGVLHSRDLARVLSEKNLNKQIRTVMRKPYFIPETKKLDSLLRQFQKRNEHMAIVVDEHGGVSGLVTYEDVLQEIVGGIVDETDRIKSQIQKINKNEWLVLAKMDIEEVNEKLRLNLEVEEDYDTLGGYILNRLGRFPKTGEKIEKDDITLKVEECDKVRILKVRVIKG